MKIPLQEFEQHIDETILKRGLSYFKNGHVNPPEEVNAGVYEAVVEGSEDYTVQLKIQNTIINEYSCTCPYDLGPVCKHVAALIFYLQQEELDLKPGTKKKKQERKAVKKKTIAQKIDELLDALSHDELKQFIKNQSIDSSSFRNLILSHFAYLTEGETQELYAKQIKSILNAAGARRGFIDWSASRSVGKAVYELMNTGETHYRNGNYKSAILICCAVMEELTEAIEYTDDSGGYIGGNIENAVDLLGEISSGKITEEIRSYLFDYCINTFNKGIFSGWDWHITLLHIASDIFKTEEEAKTIIALIDKTHFSNYETEVAQDIKLKIIRKTKGEQEATAFLEQNISNPNFRTTAIKKAIKEKNFEKAITLAKDGVKNDKNLPGLVLDWYEWLMKIAMQQKDVVTVIKYARLLFIDCFNRDPEELYHILITYVTKNEWNNFVESLINDIQKQKPNDFRTIAWIYIHEHWWHRLLALIKQNSSLPIVESYEKYLSKDYAGELTILYEQGILEGLKLNTGRDYYKNICKYLRRMSKLGATERVKQLIENFRKEYPQRRALLEELNRV